MTEKPEATRRRPLLAATALVAVALAAVGVYAFGVAGNRQNDACGDAAAVAARLAPLATGAVAAVSVQADPKPAPVLAFRRPDGSPVTLADFRGRTVLLNLWATWCAPCREEMPALDSLQKTLGSDGFEVVAINIDTRDAERAGAFLDEIGVTGLTRYADPSAAVFVDLKRAGIAFGMPTTMLIDRQGCELARLAGPADWASAEAKALVTAALGH